MKEVTLELVCDLDEEELGQRAQSLSLTTLKIDEVEDNKATVNKDFKEELTELRDFARRLSRTLRSKTEVRPVLCLVEYNSPVPGTKRIARKDTGEFYRDEAMTAEECQMHMFDHADVAEATDLADLAARVESASATQAVLAVIDGQDEVHEPDELYDDAVRLVFEFGKASTSMLQRRLRIGYGRASKLLDSMFACGLIGPAKGSSPRELLKSEIPKD